MSALVRLHVLFGTFVLKEIRPLGKRDYPNLGTAGPCESSAARRGVGMRRGDGYCARSHAGKHAGGRIDGRAACAVCDRPGNSLTVFKSVRRIYASVGS